MEINGKYYTIDIRPENETDYKAIIDNDGNPQMVKLKNNYTITSYNGELVFMEEMNQWS